GSPVMTRPAVKTLASTITESCGVADLRIYRIVLALDNANGQGVDKMTSVSWGTTVIWTGANNVADIDRSANPLVMGSYQAQTVNAVLSKDARGDNATLTIYYRVGGQLGSC